MNNQVKYKIPKDTCLYTQYSNGSIITHLMVKKYNVESNKMWILLSVENDGTLKKVAQGANPLKLEDKIDYIKAIKDAHQ
jgi:hypothetical protein